MTPPLAEVVEEGRYVLAKWAPAEIPLREAMGVPVRVAVLERLLAVAEAAVEMRRVYDYALPILFEGPGGTAAEIEAETMMSEADAAFDAAARGEK